MCNFRGYNVSLSTYLKVVSFYKSTDTNLILVATLNQGYSTVGTRSDYSQTIPYIRQMGGKKKNLTKQILSPHELFSTKKNALIQSHNGRP